MRVFGLKNCDTCRKALAALAATGKTPEFVDVRADGLCDETRARFLAAFGEALINRRSTTWRELDEATRAHDPGALLRAHPTLMKRPVIETGGALYLGWGKEVQEALL